MLAACLLTLMALLTIYFLLLQLSIWPLFHASSLCPERGPENRLYCPAGADCSSNSNLCELGVCEATTAGTCEPGS